MPLRALGTTIVAAAILALTAPQASATECGVGNSRGYGTTYVLAISVKNVSCSRGKAVIRAFHDCRPGKAGRCSRVAGYRCSEERFNRSEQSYDSRVKCRRGMKRVNHVYTQFT